MGGTVVSMEPGQPDGETADVLIENDRITEIGTLGTIAGPEFESPCAYQSFQELSWKRLSQFFFPEFMANASANKRSNYDVSSGRAAVLTAYGSISGVY
jgi:hypothetical protein